MRPARSSNQADMPAQILVQVGDIARIATISRGEPAEPSNHVVRFRAVIVERGHPSG